MLRRTLVSHFRDPVWLGSRARNASRRPGFILAATAAVIAIAALSLVAAPKQRRRPGPLPSLTLVPVDTVALAEVLQRSNSRVASAESTLSAVRSDEIAAAARPKAGQLDPAMSKRHDSLTNVLTDLQSLIGKVETAPLPTSYRALAASPALIANPKVLASLDSLHEVEKDRDSYGSTGGSDPLFIALTARVTDIGRAIEAIAGDRRDSLRSTITRMTAPRATITETRDSRPDTMPWVAERDSAKSAQRTAVGDLATGRKQIEFNREELKRTQEISVISASPFAMIVAAAVFGIVLGFALTLRSEIQNPTVASGVEIERLSGIRVLAEVHPTKESTTEERRQANRVAPKYLDFNGDSYRLAHLQVEQSLATPNLVAIIGNDPDVSAIVAMNLAAIAVEDARSVLVVDSAGTSEAIRSLLPFSGGGNLSEVANGHRSWIEATAQVPVGRDKMIQVVASDRPIDARSLIDLLARSRGELGQRYDTVLLTGDLDFASLLTGDHSIDGVVVTATTGATALGLLIGAIEALRRSALPVFGVVLWDAAPPRLAARAKRRGGGDRKRSSPLITTPAMVEASGGGVGGAA